MKYIIILSILIGFTSCSTDIEVLKKEILETERAFAQMAEEEGIKEAFLFYAADNAVLMRNDMVIEGKEAINNLFGENQQEGITLAWEPDYIDVSSSGDLAYTYGKFTYSALDSTGKEISSSGIFHTVWKRQEDGSWKYVWD